VLGKHTVNWPLVRILIIGGTALIGPHLVRELLLDQLLPGKRNVIHTLTRTGKTSFCETAHRADRSNKSALKGVIQTIKPDAVIDMIPFTRWDADVLVSALAELDLSIPVVAISSIDVYAAYAHLHQSEKIPFQQCPITETMPLRTKLGPEGPDYDKLAIESIYQKHIQNLCVLRLPAIYGWPDTTRVADYLEPMLNGESHIRLSEDKANWMFSRCLHKNAAYAIYLAVSARLTGQHFFNVGEEVVFTEREWIQKIAAHCGWSGELDESMSEASMVDWKQHFYVCTQRIRTELGYKEKYSIEEGLADTIAFHAYQRGGGAYEKYY